MKRILIPTDFSPCAKNALFAGGVLAKATGAEIILLHVLYSPLGLERIPPKMAEYPEIKEAVLHARTGLKKEISAASLKGLVIETKIEIGTPAPTILSIASTWKADMIVMGTHGNDDAVHPFVGSTAQKVLRGADCPVLSVQTNHKLKNLSPITFASVFDDNVQKPFTKIMNVARDLNADVRLLHINTPIAFKNTRTINAQIDDFEKRFPKTKFKRALHADFDVHSGIAAYLAENPVGIVALIARPRHKKPSYTLGVTESVIYHSPVPVLSVNVK